MEERLIAMEEKIAHQENLLEQLNSALTYQHQDLEKLKKTLSLVTERLQELMTANNHDPSNEPPPPHY